ncbi:two-component sensor histidine kinase [Ramlibacter aquaticus]|uniref:histidine kinase n=2 Tax=Ramlibacter TaxID=174951 RepID=A0ABR9SE11_9BURK|nr:ATP-binding protein [Ramlibacter aquaticus]MBE7940129.1 two-component sensor histidine kinase [Ramlibacter aquaticus]
MKWAGPHRSLQWRLSFGLFAAIVLTGVLAGVLSYVWALHDANEILDGTLDDTMSLISSGQMALPTQAAQLRGSEPENDVLVVPLGASGSARTDMAAMLDRLQNGIHSVQWEDRGWRVLVSSLQPGVRVAVAQQTQVRDEIAQHSAIRTLIPLLLLIPLLVLLVREVVRRTLAPIASLAQHVDSNAIGPAARLPDADVPLELEPFVNSIRRLLQELTDTLEHQRRFVGNAAHELRSPMAALQLQAANMETVLAGDEARARLGQLRLGIQRMQQLLEQLLSMARSETEWGERRPVRLGEVAREVIAECVTVAAAKEIDLGMDRCDMDLFIAGTWVDIATLLRNVLENALKYSPPGSSVTVSVYADGTTAVLTVEDQGPGIPPQHLRRAFEPFYRVPGVQEPGTGLGLAIVAAIAKRMAGHATLQTREGSKGMRFEYRQLAVPAEGRNSGVPHQTT